ncbi:MAG TPA: hypothetical protein VFZ04_10965 [Longimicrobiales bacterium]
MSRFLAFKLTVFALLASNAVVYAAAGTGNEALDSAAWFVLLVLFEVETGLGTVKQHRGAAPAIRLIRFLAALAIAAAALGYVRDEAWLDAINATLWIGVVALLEFEVRWPVAAATHRAAFLTVASSLYAALAAIVLVWAWQGEWFDAYDGLLWLVAFVAIELNVQQASRHEARNASSGEGLAEVGDKP